MILFGRATAIAAVSSCVGTLLRFVTRFRFNTHISNCPAKKSFLQVAVSKARRAAVSPTAPPDFRRRASDTALRLPDRNSFRVARDPGSTVKNDTGTTSTVCRLCDSLLEESWPRAVISIQQYSAALNTVRFQLVADGKAHRGADQGRLCIRAGPLGKSNVTRSPIGIGRQPAHKGMGRRGATVCLRGLLHSASNRFHPRALVDGQCRKYGKPRP